MPAVLGKRVFGGCLSVDRTGGYDPLAALACDGSDPIKVCVVVQDCEVLGLGCRSHQQVGHLAAALMR
jgi:hypothetical protein